MNEWEAKYRALLAGIEDQELIDNAEKLVEVAIKMSTSSILPFEAALYSLLQTISILRKPLDLSVFEPRLSISFAWYDLRAGLKYDTKKKALYICLPCIVIKLKVGARK